MAEHAKMPAMRLGRRELAAVFLGGFAGTVLRALLETHAGAAPGDWPWATFAVNVAGAFALGWLATRLPLLSPRRPLLTTGFCGALTTFSAMQLELLHMLDEQRVGLAVAYAAASVAVGLLAATVATRLARGAPGAAA